MTPDQVGLLGYLAIGFVVLSAVALGSALGVAAGIVVKMRGRLTDEE